MGLFEEVERIARRPAAEQDAWMAALRNDLASRPDREEVIKRVQDAMDAVRDRDSARLGVKHAAEMMEGNASQLLEDLLSGKGALSPHDDERRRTLLYLTLSGHLFPLMRVRMQERDAQEFLHTAFTELFKSPT